MTASSSRAVAMRGVAEPLAGVAARGVPTAAEQPSAHGWSRRAVVSSTFPICGADALGHGRPDARRRRRTRRRSHRCCSCRCARTTSCSAGIAAYRQEVRPFSDKQIALLQNFAAQAVIAMENARLLSELRERTEELAARNSAYGERIEHQAATIDVLKAMSGSPGDPQPVFDLITAHAQIIGNADVAALLEFDGRLAHLRSVRVDAATTPRSVVASYEDLYPAAPSRASLALRAILEGRVVHIPNMAEDLRIVAGLAGHLTEGRRGHPAAAGWDGDRLHRPRRQGSRQLFR
mgnify:CR=1 FL=1